MFLELVAINFVFLDISEELGFFDFNIANKRFCIFKGIVSISVKRIVVDISALLINLELRNSSLVILFIKSFSKLSFL